MALGRSVTETVTEALTASLRRLGDEFKPNRLAYLSLTSKNERLLCGSLARLLHETHEDEPAIQIRREWGKR